MLKSLLAIVFLSLFSFSAFAGEITDFDIGTYALTNAKGEQTGMKMRLSRKNGKWLMEGKEGQGPWENLSCDRGCEFQPVTEAEKKMYLNSFPAGMQDGFDIACIKNVANAFCRLTKKNNPAQGGYALIALVTRKPVPMSLQRLTVPYGGEWVRQAAWLPSADAKKQTIKREVTRAVAKLAEKDGYFPLSFVAAYVEGMMNTLDRNRGNALIIAHDGREYARFELILDKDENISNMTVSRYSKDFGATFTKYKIDKSEWAGMIYQFNTIGHAATVIAGDKIEYIYDFKQNSFLITKEARPAAGDVAPADQKVNISAKFFLVYLDYELFHGKLIELCANSFPETANSLRAAIDQWNVKNQPALSEIRSLSRKRAISDGTSEDAADKGFAQGMAKGTQFMIKNLMMMPVSELRSTCSGKYAEQLKSPGMDYVIMVEEVRTVVNKGKNKPADHR